MPSRPPVFDIDDAKSFDVNLQGFVESLEAGDPVLAAVLKTELPKLLSGETDKTAIWDALLAAALGNAPS